MNIFNVITLTNLPVGYIEFDVNSPSTGTIEAINAKQIHPALNVDIPIVNFYAKININDTLNVKATMKIYKQGTYIYAPSLFNMDATKSITTIHSKSAQSAQKPIGTRTTIGRRQKGDELIHFQSRNVTNASRFPSGIFEYSGQEYITYVGFSFNSPTAMVLINTTYIDEKEFNSIVYDMNTEHFVANISIYGIKNAQKSPEDRVGVMSLL
ncbi:hypothetical protein HA402_001288 [Bradysia odoriphaga]|nr:hypothetical protein HA402_001288 [Bradysia odoriphaga]